MADLQQLLRVRSAYAGRFDAQGYLVFVADLAGVPQVWGVGETGWPELLVAPPDRAQTVHPRPASRPARRRCRHRRQRALAALYVDAPGAAWRALSHDPDVIHSAGAFTADGTTFSFAANSRTQRWFDVYVLDLATGETRRVLEHDSTNRAGPFSPDGRWLVVARSHSTSHDEPGSSTPPARNRHGC